MATERLKETTAMKIAVPMANGRLASHFGHCAAFEIVSVEDKTVSGSELVDAPPHEPGRLPAWLAELGVDMVIAGGMGRRAQELFCQSGIDVVVGASSDEPTKIVQAYLDGKLTTGDNLCDH